MVPIGEETWPPGVIKSKGVHEWGMLHVVEVIHPLMPLGQLIPIVEGSPPDGVLLLRLG